MKCPKCGSENVSVQIVTDAHLVDQHHGCLWWLCVGWWWIPVKWICFTVPALLLKIFVPKRQKLQQSQHTECVCQNCGHHWKAE